MIHCGLINVRAEFRVTCRRVYLSGPIRNPLALAALRAHFADQGRAAHLAIHDDTEHALIADLCLQQARLRGRIHELTWGERDQYRVEFARMPRLKSNWPVVGGFPLLEDAARQAASGERGAGSAECVAVERRAGWLDRFLAWLLGRRLRDEG